MTGSLALPWPRVALALALAVLGPGAQLEIVPAVDLFFAKSWVR